MAIKSITDLTVAEAIEEFKSQKAGQPDKGYTRKGLIMHLYIIAMSSVLRTNADDKTTAFIFLLDLLDNGSEEDKNEVRAYLG